MSDEEPSGGIESDVLSLDKVVETLRISDPDWESGVTLELPGANWTPDLAKQEKRVALHVHLAQRIRPYILERLKAAFEAGLEIHIAVTLESLYQEDFLTAISEVDPIIHLVNPEVESDQPLRLLLQLALLDIRVSSATRKILAAKGWDLAKAAADSVRKGATLEALLAFLLGQVSEFRVVDHNFRSATEEIDLVVQLTNTLGNRCWLGLAAPLILAETKNWMSKVDQTQVSAFRVKMQGKRRSVRIGFMVGTNGFTSDAKDQELRFASEDLTIVFFGGDDVVAWINADDGDAWLDSFVRKAMLR